MSDAFYNGMRDTVAGPLIEKYGLVLTLRRVVPGVYDAATGGMAASTTTDYSCFGLIEEYKDSMVAMSLVKQGDKKILLSAKNLAVAPQVGDQIVGMSDGTYYIPPEGEGSKQPVQTLAPGGIAVMYTIQVRK